MWISLKLHDTQDDELLFSSEFPFQDSLGFQNDWTSNHGCRDCNYCGLLFQQANNYLNVTVSSKDGVTVCTS